MKRFIVPIVSIGAESLERCLGSEMLVSEIRNNVARKRLFTQLPGGAALLAGEIGIALKMPSFLNDLIVADTFSQAEKEGLMSGKAAKVVLSKMQRNP